MVQLDIERSFQYFHHDEMVVLQLGWVGGEKLCRIRCGWEPWSEWHGFWRWLDVGFKLELGINWRGRRANYLRFKTLEKCEGNWFWIQRGMLMAEVEFF